MESKLSDIPDNIIREEFVNRFQLKSGDLIKNATSAANHLRAFLSDQPRDVEHFVVIFMNNQNKVITTEIVASGTINSSAVYPRQIAIKALEKEATNIILAHNHPSGETMPSSSDRAVTSKLKTALGSLDIEILDHIIIGEDHYSFADAGVL
ncbi:MAG: DNA repair protein RadC [Candidatus Marinimicrobia bacterium]|nr:DNA repair protein RadC [Candidatus Neomarinimicrobiota bacterium]